MRGTLRPFIRITFTSNTFLDPFLKSQKQVGMAATIYKLVSAILEYAKTKAIDDKYIKTEYPKLSSKQS